MLDIHPSARKHGITDADIEHAMEQALVVTVLEEDRKKVLYVGPDRAGNLLEVIAIRRTSLPELVIHAMRMRPRYADLLRGLEERDA